VIKAIIFDCFGVLTTDLWKEFRASLPAEQQQPAHDINHAYDAGLISETEFIKQVRELTGRNPGEVEMLPKNQTNKNIELLNFIAELRPKYKIGMLSNIASDWVRDSFLTSDEQALFDDMVFSHEVGMTKPDPRIFEIACERLGVEPEDTVLVDDIEQYCMAAQTTGMRTIVYDNFKQLYKDLEQLLSQS
jgi:putative hydrolase of the HAD superfamily